MSSVSRILCRAERSSLHTLGLIALTLAFTACGGSGQQTAAPTPSQPAAQQPASDAPSGGETPSGSAAISGKITYQGEVPKFKAISMDADPGCSVKHGQPVMPELLVLGDGNTMANVMVRVTSGVADKQWAVPSEPVVVDQRGCVYVPHVLGVMAGQKVKILNSDGLMHNVHALPEKNKEFNKAMPATQTETEVVFSKSEDPFKVKCDVHPWMAAYVAVLDHPFFAVTGKDGSFNISGLQPGTYEIEAWHERLGTQTATVTVGDGETGTADFTFSRS